MLLSSVMFGKLTEKWKKKNSLPHMLETKSIQFTFMTSSLFYYHTRLPRHQ